MADTYGIDDSDRAPRDRAPRTRVSVVVPCRNEGPSLERVFDALRGQDQPVHEVVVVDDGSTDDTPERVARYGRRYPQFPLRLVSRPHAGIPGALNAGIAAAEGEVILRLDAHVHPAPDYVRCSLEGLAGDGWAAVVGGVWEIAPGAPSWVARAIALAVAHPLGAGDASYRTGRTRAGPHPVDTVPFGCFTKALWRELGGFNVRLLTNEDYEFNYRVRQTGRRVILDPRIRSTYFSRPTLGALAAQYFRYGWWKAEMLRANPASLRWRQAVPAGFVASVLLLLAAAIPWAPPRRPLAALLATYLATLVLVSAFIWRGRRPWRILPLLPAAFATIHFAWGTGVIVNLVSRGRWPGMRGPRAPRRAGPV